MYIYIFKNALYPAEARKVVTSFPIRDRRILQDMVNGSDDWRNPEYMDPKKFWVLVDIHT